MHRSYRFYVFCTAFFFAISVAYSQTPVEPWTNTGPVAFPTNVSGQVHGLGRVSQIKFHPTNSQKIYAVSASGGLYLTVNNGANWAPMAGTEKFPQTSTSAVCINRANDQTLYLCLGDANYYSNKYGIYKSTNGGLTWSPSNTGIGTNMAVEILMDPADTNKLVAATKGGIYSSNNGGANWVQTQTGAFKDMKAKPTPGGSQTLYAATGTDFYYSINFGATWNSTSITVPSSNAGIRIAVSKNDTNRVYLVSTGGNGVVYKSTNSGVSFSQVYNSGSQCLVCYDAATSSGSQGNYNLDLAANPSNADELLVVAHCVWRSLDGGVTWSKRTNWYAALHTDMHWIGWNPYNNAELWSANDGGVWRSTDPLASNWSPRADGLAACEMYHAAQSPVVRELISAGTQDNGELYYTNGTWKTNRGGDWTTPCAIDYRNNGTVWYLARGKRRNLLPLGSDQLYNVPYAPNNGTFVSNEVARIAFVKGLPAVAFTGRDSIYRCSNTASTSPSWQRILTTTEQVRAIESCAADSTILYVATKANHLFRSDNALSANPTFTQLTSPASTSVVASIATSAKNAQVVFMSCGNNIYRSTNKGATWTSIAGTGLSGLNIRKIIHDDYSTTQRLFVNAGAYVHYKDSTTTTWTNHTTTAGLPTVANATDLMIYNDGTANSVLRLSTYGRGVWEANIQASTPPVPDFTSDKTFACPGDTVRFAPVVTGNFTSLSWSFPGGIPSTSTATAPVVVYPNVGVGTYGVTLSATNASGSNSITRPAYINVYAGVSPPIVEGFEGTTFPPAGWQLKNESTLNWEKTSTASGFGQSTQSIVSNNFNFNSSGTRNSIILPMLNLTGISNASLKFDVAYAPFSSAYPDSLQVRISTNCGTNWTPLYTKTGTALATAPSITNTTFVPTATQWRTDSVSLLPYIGTTVLISFDNIGRYGQQIFLDNIKVVLPQSGNPLPVDLLAFRAKTQGTANVLEWNTTTETVGTTFEVTRSTTGSDFEKIGTINGGRNSYTYRDETPPAQVSYYRLKMLEPSGKFTASAIAIVKRGELAGGLALWPVPAENSVTITNNNPALEDSRVTVLDVHGRIMTTVRVSASVKLDIQEWPTGVYVLKFEDGSILKLVKQ